MKLGITGSSGLLGSLVARNLANAGLTQRLLVRDLARAPLLAEATAVFSAGYGDAVSSVQALHGIDVLFMVSASESADRVPQHKTFIDAAVAAGVQHVVYTSFLGAAPSATFTLARDHWATEEAIKASGLRYTFLRDNLYLDVLPHFAGDDGVIRGPAGQGHLSAVARADIARAAASVLQHPEAHVNVTYELTGSEALTLDEIARMLSDVTGRATRFHDETIPEAHASRARYNAPAWQVEAWVSTYLAIRHGEMATITNAVESLTGQAPLTLRQFLATN